ncbi:hypothetical protein WJX79_009367 [Trebouxia sp. C0005]
MHWCMNIKY